MKKSKHDKLITEAILRARLLLIDQYKEHFIGVYLNQTKEIIKDEIISVGTLTASIVHPREVFRPALKVRACYIIVLHNHPSGSVEPSKDDLELTEQLIKAGKILGVEVMAHIIFNKGTFNNINFALTK